ncbi:MAG: ATP-binding protein, partial [Candidatus Omnitrophica bacterium]|nr:ATP-binding protein [Candidatus Omnitrophota bacterium]
EEVKDLLLDLKRGQNVIVFSPRRYGKTSLIKKVLSILEKEKVLVFYIDLYAATTKRKFIDIYARAVARGTKGKIQTIVNNLKIILPALIPKIVVKGEGTPDFEFDYGRKVTNLSPILDDLYESVEKYAKTKKKKAVVVFDEFQEILNLEDEDVERTMRSSIQGQKNTTYVFMGSKKHLIEKLFENANRPFYKSGRLFPLYKIGANKFSVFIKKKFSISNINLTQNIITQILDVSECHPYYTQMLCSVIWDRCLGKEKITKQDVIRASDELISREAQIYFNIWDNLPSKQKMFLESLVLEGSSSNIYSQDFCSKYELGTVSNLQKTVKMLIKKGLVEKENGSLIIADIFLKKWIFKTILS